MNPKLIPPTFPPHRESWHWCHGQPCPRAILKETIPTPAPPCQAFTFQGRGSRKHLRNERPRLTAEFVRLLKGVTWGRGSFPQRELPRQRGHGWPRASPLQATSDPGVASGPKAQSAQSSLSNQVTKRVPTSRSFRLDVPVTTGVVPSRMRPVQHVTRWHLVRCGLRLV